MKRLFLTVLVFVLACNLQAFAESENIVLLTKKGFFDKTIKKSCVSSYDEIKKSFEKHYEYSNAHNLDGLSSLYTDDYYNEDGFSKKIYFKLIKKTWASYPDIKYKIKIKNITVNDNTAVVHVNELATATTPEHSGIIDEKGYLQSYSDTVYYMERIGGNWLVTSDNILYEKTFLLYGSAKQTSVNLIAPSQISADKSYTCALKISPLKDNFVIASIGQEFITYPQSPAKEVFRKLPKDDSLERMFTSNSNNLNEYAVASYGITKAEIKNGKDIKITVTGLGFVMQRINVVPKNNHIKEEADEKTK